MSVATARANTVPLRVLIVEDSEEDTELLLLELKRGGYDPVHRRVASAAQLADALKHGTWEIVLSDFSLPGFSMEEALAMVQEAGLDIPFVIVSAVAVGGVIGFFLDRWLHTKPYLMLVLGFLGFFGGLRDVLRRVAKQS